MNYKVDLTKHHFVIASSAICLFDYISTSPPTALSPPPISFYSVASFSSNDFIICTAKKQKLWEAFGFVLFCLLYDQNFYKMYWYILKLRNRVTISV